MRLTLKTYGLPYVFWLYALASLTVVFFLWLAVRAPLAKLLTLESTAFDYFLVYGLQALLALSPLVLAGFFFYEKRLVRDGAQLEVEERLFGLVFRRRRPVPLTPQTLVVRHHLDSPNVARLQGEAEARGFQNKGYFELWYQSPQQQILLDRHSRKADVQALRELLLLGLETSDRA